MKKSTKFSFLTILIVSFVSYISGANFPVDTEEIGHTNAKITTEYLLPETIRPESYDIILKPDFEAKTIEGSVTIVVQVAEERDTIVLHTNKTEIIKEDIEIKQGATPTVLAVKSIDYKEETEFFTITLENKLAIGEATINIKKYIAKIGEANEGFYLAKYTDGTEEKVFGTTQFESTSARQAFPCFDQPDMKATFKIQIIRPKSYNSASNMPLEKTEAVEEADLEKDIFKTTTVRMPTYLIAFVVSELSATTSNPKYKVYGIPKLIADGRGEYGVKNGEEIIKAMQSFVNIDYSLEKLDQVAIPDDYFSAGAMENWGLVTYKQRYLLEKEGVTTAGERQNVLSIIAHEFAHQWFGNLVTPKWWNSLWLSEGFATYFEHYATDVVDPTMKMMDQYLPLTIQRAFESDASEGTRAMNADVWSPSDISKFFDRIAYQKAGAVIRMMEHIVTTNTFKSGLNSYLTAKREDGSVVPQDLWDGIQEAVNKMTTDEQKEIGLDTRPVKEIMETWNGQEGFPLVTVKRAEDGKITLTQERFMYKENNEETIWKIPINYVIQSDKDEEMDFGKTATQIWLESKEQATEITLENNKWIILNKQQTGFYRVNYDESIWNSIIDYLNSDNFNKIHVLNRAQLIDDAFHLARAGIISYNIPLRLSMYLTKETEYVPLTTFLKSVDFLNNYLSTTENYDYFKTFVREALVNAYKKLGVEDTNDHVEKLNRAQVISWLSRFQDEDSLDKMQKALIALKDGDKSAEPDLQNPIYCGGMRHTENTKDKFDYLYKLYTSDKVEYLEKARILSGMGCSLNKEYLTILLNAAIGENTDYKEIANDKSSAFSAAYTSSDVGVDVTLNFIVDNFEKVKNALSTNQITSIIKGIASRTTSNAHSETMKKITDEAFAEVIDGAVTTIKTNSDFAEKDLKDLQTWLTESYGSAGFVSISFTLLLGMLVVLKVF